MVNNGDNLAALSENRVSDMFTSLVLIDGGLVINLCSLLCGRSVDLILFPLLEMTWGVEYCRVRNSLYPRCCCVHASKSEGFICETIRVCAPAVRRVQFHLNGKCTYHGASF